MQVFAAGEAELNEAVGTGAPTDGAAFADWVRPHLGVLSAIAAVQVGRDDAEDVVQEALVRAWRRRGTFDPARGTARSWLAAVVVDQARRHRTRRRPYLVESSAEIAGAPSADRLDVERAVRTLPRRQREVVTLFYLADLSLAEIAGVLSISVGSVKSHLFAARAQLRIVLEES